MLTEILLVAVQLQFIRSQNQLQFIINPTGRVPHTTGVQVQERLPVRTVHLPLIQATTTAVHLRAAVAAEVTAVAAAEEVAEAHIQVEVRVEVLQEAAVDALQEVVHLLPVGDKFR